ncbi:hypothetical protein Tco_0893845 [Tanacetum coccineum]|uniref:Integrase, catalytic region, zinc finger, CCHC-type, peptidase aspartic, catalytic n=1 Tax=Tanacetum coccineum TaxID=301880 RepID=A0ABQ5CD72_9ASTR
MLLPISKAKRLSNNLHLNLGQHLKKVDTYEESDEQALEAHYMYMAKIQEYYEQPGSIYNTYVVEMVDRNIIPDSMDMCDNERKDDQNVEEPEDEHVLLASLIANLKLDVDENKKIQKQLKANTSLTQVLEKYKLDLKYYKIELERNKTFQTNQKDKETAKLKCKEAIDLLASNNHKNAKSLKTEAYKKKLVTKENDKLVNQISMQERQISKIAKEKEDLKKDFQTREDKDIDKQIALENQVKIINFLKVDDLLLKYFFSKDYFCVILLSLDDIDEYCDMACKYLEKTKECERLENELSKLQKQNHDKSFTQLEKHCINLELALQYAKEKSVCENSWVKKSFTSGNNEKAQLQDKTIVNAEMRALLNKAKGKICGKSTLFVRDLQGNDLLMGNRGYDLYTIALHESSSLTLICFMTKASPTQAWLWYRRLSHFNLDTINLLSKNDIVNGLPKFNTELGIQDHNNEPSSSKLVPDVSPLADKTNTSQQELDLLFSLMYEEYFNAGNHSVSKSSAFFVNLQQEDTQPTLNIQPTLVLTTPTTNVNAEENNNDQAGDAQFEVHHSDYHWTKDHPLEQVHGNISKPVQTRRQLATNPEMCMLALTHGMDKCDSIGTPMATSPKLDADLSVIIEQRVKVNQKARILELKRRNHEEHSSDNLYAVSIKEDTAYPCPKLHSASMKRISICRIQMKPYAEMDDPNITMEEYVQRKTERALKNAIAYDDALTSKLEFSYEPTVSPQHVDEVNWKIETSLSESDDENYTIIYDNDLFSYKIVYANDLKLDIENGDDKIDIKQFSRDIFIEPSHDVISIDVGSRYGVSKLYGYDVLTPPGRYPFYFLAL